MSGPYFFTPEIWLLIISITFLLYIAIYSLRNRRIPGALPFTVACAFMLLWGVGVLLQLSAGDVSTKLFWFKFQWVWPLPAATAITCFVLEYVWPGRWLTRRNLILLSIPSSLVLIMILTNDLHQSVWRETSSVNIPPPVYGYGGWFATIFFFILVVVNLIAFSWLFIHSPQHRWPVVLMACGQIAGRMFSLLYLSNPEYPIPNPYFFYIPPFTAYAIALFRFHIFNPIPIARQVVIDQMQEGMLVLDNDWKIANLNPAAVRILGISEKQAVGQDLRELLPSYNEACVDLDQAELTHQEIRLGTGQDMRHYFLSLTRLVDSRRLSLGHLLLLYDVSEQRQAQHQLVEQQKVVATLKERERLAHEFHDNLGQVLGYVSMQAQTIRKKVSDGDLAAAEAQLARLTNVAQGAHQDLRESIFSLKSDPAETWTFISSLEQYLDSYRENYGIRTELLIPAEVGDDSIEPSTSIQVFRVIQEALTNAHKHGDANYVQVTFMRKERSVQIVIADDGRGFDPEGIKHGDGWHYGLEFMRERMEQVEGCLAIESQPGVGTRVVVEVPLK